MIKPQELMAFAEWLAAQPGEAAGRAAVSRAYYSAFHIAKDWMHDVCGVVLPASPEVHRKLQFCLEQAGDVGLSSSSSTPRQRGRPITATKSALTPALC
jgi:hypothetical protein